MLHFNSRTELQEYIRSNYVKKLGLGREGVCSLLKDGTVIKYLHEDYYPDFALQFKDVDTPTFIFAKSGAFVGEFVSGLFMDYAEGKSLYEKKPTDQSMILLGTQLEQVVTDIKTISKQGVWIRDFHPGNMIYNGERFRIVDTLSYLSLPKDNYEEENMYEVMNRLYDFLLDDVMKDRDVYKKYIFYGRRDLIDHPKEYLTALKNYIEEISGKSITTLDDANKVLRKK